MKWVKKKGRNRRTIFGGWGNFTDFEKEWVEKIKDEAKKQLGVDLRKLKAFGPRSEDGAVVEGSHEIVSGRDALFDDALLMRMISASYFDVDVTMGYLRYHLEWRQTNVPMPVLTDRTVYLLNQGFLYIHGRAKDMSPILLFDIIKLQTLLDNQLIDPPTFCQLHAFCANYITHNMLLPG